MQGDKHSKRKSEPNLSYGEAKLPSPDHHLHLEDVPLGDSCSNQLLQDLI